VREGRIRGKAGWWLEAHQLIIKFDPTLLHIPDMVPQRDEGPLWSQWVLLGPSEVDPILLKLR